MPRVDKIELRSLIGHNKRKITTMNNNSETKALGKVVQIDDARIHSGSPR
jgi:hypothetical protein